MWKDLYLKISTYLHIEKFLSELYKYAAQESNNYIPARHELTQYHGTGVDSSQLDYNMIMMSIISISWAVRMRKTKSNEGQCHIYKTNCKETKGLHSELYKQWIETVEEVLQVLRTDLSLAIT